MNILNEIAEKTRERIEKDKKEEFYHTAYRTENERRIRYACMHGYEGA